MIEKGRVAAMTRRSPAWMWLEFGVPTSGAGFREQGSSLALPLVRFVGPIAPFDRFPARKQLPGEARVFKRIAVEQIESPVVGQRGLPPNTVGDEHGSCM